MDSRERLVKREARARMCRANGAVAMFIMKLALWWGGEEADQK